MVVALIDVAPPVPARLRIKRQIPIRRGLRIEHNQMIGVCPGIVSGIIDETPTDIANILLASMQNDMNAARRAVFACFGNEHVAGVAQA